MATATALGTLAQIRSRRQRFLHNRRSMAELAACPTTATDRSGRRVEQAGLARTLHCCHPGPTELMPQRLLQLGLDPGFVKHALPTTYRDMERVCATCTSWRLCSRDLSNNDVQPGMQGYCLNAFTIDALTVDGPMAMRV